jgi:hypothetical protein
MSLLRKSALFAVRPELVEGPKYPFMVRQAHQERDCIPDSCENDIFILSGAYDKRHDDSRLRGNAEF